MIIVFNEPMSRRTITKFDCICGETINVINGHKSRYFFCEKCFAQYAIHYKWNEEWQDWEPELYYKGGAVGVKR